MRNPFTRTLCALLAMLYLTVTTAGAVSFPGEEIKASPESLREEHESYAFAIVEAIARYAADDTTGSPILNVSVKDSPAVTAIRRFDGGWFPAHRSLKFANQHTENWSGDGITQFTCEVYMDCVVAMKSGSTMVYDMAYKLEFVCPDPTVKSEKRWKLQRFTNIPQTPDTIDMAQVNLLDEGIRIEAVTGPTFKGFMVIISDPSRVYVGSVPQPYSNTAYGWTLDQFAERSGAVVAINGGAFADPDGMGKGGKPNGLVVTQGILRQNHITGRAFGTVIGFDGSDRLIVREGPSREEVAGYGLRDAVAFSPALIIDGETVDNSNFRTDLSARTAIGQREDGTVLMLVVDGRQPDSFGANMSGMAQIMRNYGAVNAANLDGGTSTALMFYGHKINDGSGPDRVSRHMATAFLVRPADG